MTQTTWQNQGVQRTKTLGGWHIGQGSREKVGKGPTLGLSENSSNFYQLLILDIRHLNKRFCYIKFRKPLQEGKREGRVSSALGLVGAQRKARGVSVPTPHSNPCPLLPILRQATAGKTWAGLSMLSSSQ